MDWAVLFFFFYFLPFKINYSWMVEYEIVTQKEIRQQVSYGNIRFILIQNRKLVVKTESERIIDCWSCQENILYGRRWCVCSWYTGYKIWVCELTIHTFVSYFWFPCREFRWLGQVSLQAKWSDVNINSYVDISDNFFFLNVQYIHQVHNIFL